MNSTNRTSLKPTAAAIEKRAYELWEKDGRKPGQSEKYWLQAEKELHVASQPAEPAKAASETTMAASPKASVVPASAAAPTPKPKAVSAPKLSAATPSKVVAAPKPAKPAVKRRRAKAS